MPIFFITYDATSGAILWIGQTDSLASVAAQPLPTGSAIIVVPQTAIITGTPDIAIIKTDICAKIEAQADAVAATIITLSPRKVQTVAAIKEEADRWITGGTAANFPFLNALATASGTTIDQEKAAFDTAYAAAVPPGALINATSVAAQRKVMAATTLAGIAAAAAIDWPAVMATLA